MSNSSMMHQHIWKPFAYFGFNHSFWNLQADTLISTWIIIVMLFILGLYINRCLNNENSSVRFATLVFVRTFQDLITQAIQSCPIAHLTMIGSFFSFIFLCNTIQFIPWLEEPTKDLNTTLALGLISFFYVQISSIRYKGFAGYAKHYVQPFVFMLPLHIIGAISSIISISFRLFGNIFGSFIICSLYNKMLSTSAIAQLLGIFSGANLFIFMVFGIFEGLIQSFVFTMLTLTYLSMEIAPEGDNHD